MRNSTFVLFGIFFHLLVNLGFSAAPQGKGMHYLSDDVVWMETGEATREAKPFGERFSDEDCRAKIKSLVCLVDNTESGLAFQRKCLPDSPKYVPAFEAIYDIYPPVLQKMFCSVSKIFVEKQLDSTAYASPNSYAIGIRQSLVEGNFGLGRWATWKEQLPFGGSLTSYSVKTDLPSFSAISPGLPNDFLYDVIAHEFGHLFDFANHINSRTGAPKAGSWTALSWDDFSTPKHGNDYSHREDICFYDCTSALKKEVVPELYQELFSKTNFLNTYTSRNPYEDFADTFGFYVLFKYQKTEYVLNTNQGEKYDFRKELDSGRMKEKVTFIEDFLSRSDILYP